MYHLFQHDVLDQPWPIKSGSCHVCITSPPYWGLRKYTGCGDKQLGSEPTPQEWAANLVQVFREVRRCLHETGVLFVNCGDAWANSGQSGRQNLDQLGKHYRGGGKKLSEELTSRAPTPPGYKPLDLIGLPWLLAQALRADGWYLRDELIWRKTSPMPCSVDGWRWERCRIKVRSQPVGSQKSVLLDGPRRRDVSHGKFIGSAEFRDCPGCPKCEPNNGLILRRGSWRTTRAHEQIFLFSKTDRYYMDAVAAAEPAESATLERERYSRVTKNGKTNPAEGDEAAVKHDHESFSGGTRNPRSVQTFKMSPTKLNHTAAFPLDLPARLIRWSTSAKGYCPGCGMPWVRVVKADARTEAAREAARNGARSWDHKDLRDAPGSKKSGGYTSRTETLGWRLSCTCNLPDTVSATVLDPFSGTGTTVLAAVLAGHNGIGLELSAEYVAMAERRLRQHVGLFAGASRQHVERHAEDLG